MSKSRFVIDKFAKLFEQGVLNSKDLGNEILNLLKSKRDEIIFKMKITSKEETDILNMRVEKLENWHVPQCYEPFRFLKKPLHSRTNKC